MAQQNVNKPNDELLRILKVDDKGWNTCLFEDDNRITGCLCDHCNSVCCDAVELGCDHDDNHIFTYCNQCLSDLIQDNDGKCPINTHKNPVICSARSIRRQISKSMVVCPYSIKYKQKCNKEISDDSKIIDTFGNEQKEGIILNNNNNNNSINVKGCEWKGTLYDVLYTDHLNECVAKYNPSFLQNVKINELQQTIKDQKFQLQQQMHKINTLQIQYQQKNHQIAQQMQVINDLKSKLSLSNNEKQEFKQQLNEQSEMIQNFINTIEIKNEAINKLKQHIAKMSNANNKTDSEQKEDVMTSMNRNVTVLDSTAFCMATNQSKMNLVQKLSNIKPMGQRSLRDAICMGIISILKLKNILTKMGMNEYEFHHIIFTDGSDISSQATHQDLTNVVNKSGDIGNTYLIGLDINYKDRRCLQGIADLGGSSYDFFAITSMMIYECLDKLRVKMGMFDKNITNEQKKFAILFTLDMSGAMSGGRWKKMMKEIAKFMIPLKDHDVVGCITFNDKVIVHTEQL